MESQSKKSLEESEKASIQRRTQNYYIVSVITLFIVGGIAISDSVVLRVMSWLEISHDNKLLVTTFMAILVGMLYLPLWLFAFKFLVKRKRK